MNDLFVNDFNNLTFNQIGNDSVIVKVKFYNPPNLLFQHLPVKEKVKNIEVNRLRNGYVIDILIYVDIHEIFKLGGKVFQTYEGVIRRENF